MKVKARPGLRVPREDNPRRYIEQEEIVVPETAYYHRQVKDGDLLRVDGDAGAADDSGAASDAGNGADKGKEGAVAAAAAKNGRKKEG